MRVSVFCGVSVDGFIARRNGDLDFLEAGGAEPHGFEEFFAGIDVLAMGRLTFEKVLTMGDWPFLGKRVVVLSGRPLDLSGAGDVVVEQMAGDPASLVARLEASGARNLYIDGGVTIQGFLRAGCVDRLIVTRVPVLIGDGIPLFGALPEDVRLRHVETRTYAAGLVQTEYEVLANTQEP